MEELYAIKNTEYIFNHRIYNNLENRVFAMHAHDRYELIFVKKGTVKYSIENQIFYAKQNDLIIIQPFSYHFFEIESDSDYEKIGVLFTANTLPLALHIHLYASKVSLSEDMLLYHCLNKLIYYYKTFEKEVFINLLGYCVQEIIYNLSLLPLIAKKEHQHSKLVLDAISYINENLFTIQSVLEISNHLFVSKNYFSNIFSKEMNISVKSYIREKRLQHARAMILAGKKATHIYTSLGFASYPAFYRAYVNRFGNSPAKTVNKNIENSIK